MHVRVCARSDRWFSDVVVSVSDLSSLAGTQHAEDVERMSTLPSAHVDAPMKLPGVKTRVYTAGKLKDADLWKRLRDQWTEVEFTARWPVCHVGVIPDTPTFAKVFWEHDLEDVAAADVVLVYTPSTVDRLKGGLVEAGMGIALNKQVVVVGDHPDYGTWQFHRNVHRVKNLDEARLLLRTMRLTLA